MRPQTPSNGKASRTRSSCWSASLRLLALALDGLQLLDLFHQIARRQVAADVVTGLGDDGRCAPHADALSQGIFTRHGVRAAGLAQIEGSAGLGARQGVVAVGRTPYRLGL